MLTPVSFRKGRKYEPRLSEPYVPGRHSDRYWRDDEIDVIRRHYEIEGPSYCVSHLGDKSLHQVYAMANKLRLRAPKSGSKRTRIGTAYDAAILEAWPMLVGRGAVQRLADQLGLKRHAVSHRALALGLTMPHRKEPAWTPEEDDLLRKAPVNNPDAASAFFAAHGFRRTPASIMVRCKRKGVSRRLQGVLSARQAAQILGIESKTLGKWAADGDLVATPRGTKRLSQQGGDVWSIQPSELRRFILANLDRIDIRKVDKHAFVALVAGTADAGVVA